MDFSAFLRKSWKPGHIAGTLESAMTPDIQNSFSAFLPGTSSCYPLQIQSHPFHEGFSDIPLLNNPIYQLPVHGKYTFK
jgi:hypothetical protein